ncbi:hypothetical protein [Amycolatopsis taiwanensis]|uniref:hypothetical protein n=1 Tax=Amycolatopsis taiwanensis TaxID=342230 RepID=UPI0004B5C369|nr:hypothetical protein [Amycolatopsis taiwanensis]
MVDNEGWIGFGWYDWENLDKVWVRPEQGADPTAEDGRGVSLQWEEPVGCRPAAPE